MDDTDKFIRKLQKYTTNKAGLTCFCFMQLVCFSGPLQGCHKSRQSSLPSLPCLQSSSVHRQVEETSRSWRKTFRWIINNQQVWRVDIELSDITCTWLSSCGRQRQPCLCRSCSQLRECRELFCQGFHKNLLWPSSPVCPVKSIILQYFFLANSFTFGLEEFSFQNICINTFT